MTDASSSFDPQAQQAQDRLDAGTRALEQGDLEGAAKEYAESLKIKDSAIGKFEHTVSFKDCPRNGFLVGGIRFAAGREGGRRCMHDGFCGRNRVADISALRLQPAAFLLVTAC